jgi:hypothetical protein
MNVYEREMLEQDAYFILKRLTEWIERFRFQSLREEHDDSPS